jgi:hypothetical protein
MIGRIEQIAHIALGRANFLRRFSGPRIGRPDDGLGSCRETEHHTTVNRRNEGERLSVPDTLPRDGDVNALAATQTFRSRVGAEIILPDPRGIHRHARAKLFAGRLTDNRRADSLSPVAHNGFYARVIHDHRSVLTRGKSVRESEARIVGRGVIVDGARIQVF